MNREECLMRLDGCADVTLRLCARCGDEANDDRQTTNLC